MRLFKAHKYEDNAGMLNNEVMNKLAMAVMVRPPTVQDMRREGINWVGDEAFLRTLSKEMPGADSTKREVKKLLTYNLALPRVIFWKRDQVVEINGRRHVILDIKEPTKRDFPNGVLTLLDVETGDISTPDLTPHWDTLKSIGRQLSQQDVAEVNAAIAKWNDKVANLGDTKNPTTWPLQIYVAEKTVNERLDTIDHMIQSIQARQQTTPSTYPGFEKAKEEIAEDIRSGVISQEKDVIDSFVWLWFNNKAAAESIINQVEGGATVGNLTPEIAAKIRSVLSVHSEAKAKARQKEIELAEKKRLQTEQLMGPAAKHPTVHPFTPVDPIENPPKPDKYFSPEKVVQQMHQQIQSLSADKVLLEPVSATLAQMREYLKNLPPGSRADKVLGDPNRGAEITETMRRFLADAKKFLANYVTDIFRVKKDEAGNPTDSYELNPALIGYRGGTGNGEVAVMLNMIYSVVERSLAGYEQAQQTAAPQA